MASNARNSDPSTSHRAARNISQSDRSIVHFAFYKHRKLADFQLDDLLGGHQNGRWRKRRADLTRDELLVMTEEELLNPRTNKMQAVWTLAEQKSNVVDLTKPFASFHA